MAVRRNIAKTTGKLGATRIAVMRVVVTGASGQLGSYLVERLVAGGHQPIAWSGSSRGARAGVPIVPVDLTDAGQAEHALAEADPEVVFHAAALSASEAVLRDPVQGRALNVDATRRLAAWCARHRRRLVFTSTDLVFDGSRGWYREDDPAEPVMAYGRTKREAERAVIEAEAGLVARVSLLFGPSKCGRESYFGQTLAAIRAGRSQTLFDDEFRTPIDLATAAQVLVRLAETGTTGLIHVAGAERMSRFELIRRASAALGLDVQLVRANRRAEAVLAEPRPADVSLDCTRLLALWPDLKRPTVEQTITS
jgi:dTDP-4-dehydrorhamnose reductase